MNQNEIGKIEELFVDLHTNLNILRSAVTNSDNDLYISDIVDFVERIYQESKEISGIFGSSIESKENL